MGDAADGVRRAVPEVHAAVAVVINGVVVVAAGHELCHAHRPGVGAFDGERVFVFAFGEAEEVVGLFAEERRARWVVYT